MISKDFLNKLLSFARDTDKDIDAWKGVGIDIIYLYTNEYK